MSGAARMRLRGPHSVFPILGVTDLAIAAITGSEVNVSWTPAPNAVDAEIRFRAAGTGAWGAWQNFDNDLTIAVEDRTNYQFQLRELDVHGECGPRSNIALYETFVPKIAIKDYSTKTFTGTTEATGLATPDLTALDKAISFAAGDRVFIFGCVEHGLIGGSATTAGAPSGWTSLFPFAVTASPNHAIAGYWKDVDGTETTVNVFDEPGIVSTATRSSYVVVVVTLTGGTFFEGQTPNKQATTGTPSLQTISCTGDNGPALAWGFACNNGASSAFPIAWSVFTANPPWFECIKDTTALAAPFVNASVRMKIFPNGEIPATFTVRMVDLGNNGLASGWFGVA